MPFREFNNPKMASKMCIHYLFLQVGLHEMLARDQVSIRGSDDEVRGTANMDRDRQSSL